MAQDLDQRLSQLGQRQAKELIPLFDAMRADMVAVRAEANALIIDLAANRVEMLAAKADINAHRAAIVGVTAQLDLDGGVTDTTYASGNDPVADTMATLAALTAAAAAALTVTT